MMSVNHEKYHEYSKALLLLQSLGYVVLTNVEYEAIGEANATIDDLQAEVARLAAERDALMEALKNATAGTALIGIIPAPPEGEA